MTQSPKQTVFLLFLFFLVELQASATAASFFEGVLLTGARLASGVFVLAAAVVVGGGVAAFFFSSATAGVLPKAWKDLGLAFLLVAAASTLFAAVARSSDAFSFTDASCAWYFGLGG